MHDDADDELEAADDRARVAQRRGQELALAVDVDHGVADVVQRDLQKASNTRCQIAGCASIEECCSCGSEPLRVRITDSARTNSMQNSTSRDATLH